MLILRQWNANNNNNTSSLPINQIILPSVVIQGNIEMAPAEKPEQHILNSHMPRALLEQYHKCDKPPPLEIFARVRYVAAL